MQILDRYTLRQLIGPLIWCQALFFLLYLVIDLFGHLDEILRFKVPLAVAARYYGAMLPLIVVQVTPFACLMAVLYAVGHLNKHRELIAMRASGVSPWHIVRPLVAVGLLMSTVVLWISETFVPMAAQTVQTLKSDYLERAPGTPLDHGLTGQRPIKSLAVYGHGQTLLYAKTFEPQSNTLEDVVILEHGPDLKLRRKITARRAEWTGEAWRLLQCTVIRFGRDGKAMGKAVTFERKIIPGIEPPEVLRKVDRETETLSSRELRAYIARLGTNSREATRKLRVDLQNKLAFPFACLVVVLLGVPLAVSSTRGGTLLGMGVAVATSLAFYGVHALLVAAGKGGWLPPLIAAWGANVLFSALGVSLLRRRLA